MALETSDEKEEIVYRPVRRASDHVELDAQNQGMGILDFFMALRKHWLTALLVFVVVLASMAGYTFTRTKIYTAQAQMFASYNGVAGDAAGSAGTSNSVGVQSVAGTYIATQLKSYPDLVKTNAVLAPVISALNTNTLTVNRLASMVSAENPDDTYILNVSVRSADPEQAADLANRVSDSLSTVVASELYSSGDRSIVKLSVVQPAQVPRSPSSPNVTLNLLVGAFIGLILAFVAAVLRDVLSRRVQDVSDLQSISQNATIVGIIPKDNSLNGTKPIVVSNSDGSIAEEFRRIRTNLSFTTAKDGDKGRLIIVTSSMPAEGKTTIACNLAATLAENGASVLLVDADLRHPSVAKRLGFEGNVELAHVLSNQAAVKDVVQRYWRPNLHVLPAGPRIQNASVLLNSGLMETLIKRAIQQYDYVIIDTSPMSVANDAAVFGQLGNGVVLVSGKNVTFKRALRGTVTELGELDVPILGFVFNMADEKRGHGYGSYYYYGSYYNYGEYGYGADDGKSVKAKPGKSRARRSKSQSESMNTPEVEAKDDSKTE